MQSKEPKSKKTPTYDLNLFKNLLKSEGTWIITRRAYWDAVALGYTSDFEICEKIQSLTLNDFKKSDLTEDKKFPNTYQDVYYSGDLMIKLQIDESGNSEIARVVTFHNRLK